MGSGGCHGRFRARSGARPPRLSISRTCDHPGLPQTSGLSNLVVDGCVSPHHTKGPQNAVLSFDRETGFEPATARPLSPHTRLSPRKRPAFAGLFIRIGETGFEPATARPPGPPHTRFSPRKRPAFAGLSCVSGRQDLNLRPPGPQPDLGGFAEAYPLCLQGFVVSELLWVALNLDRELDRAVEQGR
jgi:hypothetical protein